MDPADISDRSRGVALALAGMLGVFGAHRFYSGRPLSGVCMLLTVGGLGIWWLYDVILITAGGFRDGEDRRLLRWWEPNPLAGRSDIASPQYEVVLEELDALRADVGELGERVDFMERVLSQARQRDALPPSAS